MSVLEPSFKKIEPVKNPYLRRNYVVNIRIPEFTCVCPRTGQPDFATIEINYSPSKLIIELKSLKLYLQDFRNLGIFHEAVINKIMDDIIRACKPTSINVIGKFNPRGGIYTEVSTKWPE